MELITLEENVLLIKRTPKAIRNMVMRKQIPFKKLAGRIVFDKDEIIAWIANAPGVSLDDLKRADR
jgi:hypothetical protein